MKACDCGNYGGPPSETESCLKRSGVALRRRMLHEDDSRDARIGGELDHIKTYLFLEQLRFGAELQVVMDIGTTDFMLPALTVQPLEDRWKC